MTITSSQSKQAISNRRNRRFMSLTYSNSSPSGLEVPVRRACLPSILSIVEYLITAILERVLNGTGRTILSELREKEYGLTSIFQKQNCNIPTREPIKSSGRTSLSIHTKITWTVRSWHQCRNTHRAYEIRNKNFKQYYVPDDEEEPQKGDHIWGDP